MRLDKYVCACTSMSRKEVGIVASRGGLTVDGRVVRDVSTHIDEISARVSVLGQPLTYRRYFYIMLNKPEGYVSATDDRSLPFVTELLPPEIRKQELFPVGRLDRDTVGLMILTNDGKLAHSLLSPKHHVQKEYRFKCKVPLTPDAETAFADGVTLADGYECKPAVLVCDPDRLGGVITLTEGKYHQIKRMIASTSNRVTFLERISFAGIPLDRGLDRGEFRFLTDDETALLISKTNHV